VQELPHRTSGSLIEAQEQERHRIARELDSFDSLRFHLPRIQGTRIEVRVPYREQGSEDVPGVA